MSVQPPAPTYRVHGLRVSSELKLDAPATDSPEHDLTIRVGARRAVPQVAPDGRLLARLDLPGAASSLVASNGRYTLRIHGHCDFDISEGLDAVSVHESPDLDGEFAGLMAGSVLATVLTLRGLTVLHASAVDVGGRAVVFIAGVGMGKTTSAALCCTAGARLVTDDVLRVEVAAGQGWCFAGSRELRLRATAAPLAARLTAPPGRSTLDERHAVRPPATASSRLPILAIVAPRFDPQSDGLHVDRIRGVAAVRELVSFPRTLGWTANEVAQRDFGVLVSLAQLVPIYRATLPQMRDRDLGQALLSAIGLPA